MVNSARERIIQPKLCNPRGGFRQNSRRSRAIKSERGSRFLARDLHPPPPVPPFVGPAPRSRRRAGRRSVVAPGNRARLFCVRARRAHLPRTRRGNRVGAVTRARPFFTALAPPRRFFSIWPPRLRARDRQNGRPACGYPYRSERGDFDAARALATNISRAPGEAAVAARQVRR